MEKAALDTLPTAFFQERTFVKKSSYDFAPLSPSFPEDVAMMAYLCWGQLCKVQQAASCETSNHKLIVSHTESVS